MTGLVASSVAISVVVQFAPRPPLFDHANSPCVVRQSKMHKPQVLLRLPRGDWKTHSASQFEVASAGRAARPFRSEHHWERSQAV